MIWIERRPGARLGRRPPGQSRSTARPRSRAPTTTSGRGYELEDCLEAANAALEDDAVVSEDDGATEQVRPFRRDELLEPLERFFFGR